MISYLVRRFQDLSETPGGELPPNLLSPAETALWRSFRFEKRRREWLLGRWTAKLLLQDYVLQMTGVELPLDCLQIRRAPDGAPLVELSGLAGRGLPLPAFRSLSISHSHGAAFCAITDEPGWRIGADMERVEPRPRGFAADYFTRDEQDRLDRAPRELRETYVTAVWSGKEAVLKALRRGLTVDTAGVRCGIDPAYQEQEEWQPFFIDLEPALVAGAPRGERFFWVGWWRPWSDYVLTLAAGKALLPVMQPLPLIRSAAPAWCFESV